MKLQVNAEPNLRTWHAHACIQLAASHFSAPEEAKSGTFFLHLTHSSEVATLAIQHILSGYQVAQVAFLASCVCFSVDPGNESQ
eukprot:s948_g5.t1